MFRRTDPQATFGSLSVLLSPEKIARLEKNHWAGAFRHKALPVLLANEQTFRPLFCEDNGRPNKPVVATLGVLILKEMSDLADEAAPDRFEFDASWQYARNVDPDQAHLCQKALHNFRVKMSEAEEEGILTYSALFDEIVRGIGLPASQERKASARSRRTGRPTATRRMVKSVSAGWWHPGEYYRPITTRGHCREGRAGGRPPENASHRCGSRGDHPLL